MQRPEREYHLVILGSGGVGKSCLTAQFVQNVWIEAYDPTIEDVYQKMIPIDGRQSLLEILDTAGTEQFTAMREIYMKSGQGFLLVFSITSLSSLRELIELREEIIRIKDDPYVPMVLVGNKADLEDDRAVTRSRAFALSQSWGNVPYYETSARRRANVDEVFVNLCRQIVRRERAYDEDRHGRGRRIKELDYRNPDAMLPAAASSSRRKKKGAKHRKGAGKRSRDICTIL